MFCEVYVRIVEVTHTCDEWVTQPLRHTLVISEVCVLAPH